MGLFGNLFTNNKKVKEIEPLVFKTERGIQIYPKERILKVPRVLLNLKGYNSTEMEIYCDIKELRIKNSETRKWDFGDLYSQGLIVVPDMYFSKQRVDEFKITEKYDVVPVFTRNKMKLKPGWVMLER